MRSLRLAIAVGVCGMLFAAAAQAQTGAVYSLNVVGFQKVNAPGEGGTALSLGSTPFDADPANIQDVIGDQLTGSNSYSASDNLLMWDEASQTYKKYWLAGDVGVPEYNHKWISVDPFGVATNLIDPGHGFFLRSRQSFTQTVVVVGDVVSDNVITTHIVQGFQLISYPYSTSIEMNDTTFTNGAHGSNSYTVSDNIMLWDKDEQTYKKYWLAGDVGAPQYNHQWISVDPFGVSTSMIHSGEGFWYRHRRSGGGFDWVEAKPYTEP